MPQEDSVRLNRTMLRSSRMNHHLQSQEVIPVPKWKVVHVIIVGSSTTIISPDKRVATLAVTQIQLWALLLSGHPIE